MKNRLISLLVVFTISLNTLNVFADKIDVLDEEKLLDIEDLLDETDILSEETVLDETDILNEEVILDKTDIISEKENRVATDSKSKKEVIMYLNSTLVIIDGLEQNLAKPPKVIDNSTYLPMRFIGEEILDAQVDWDGENKLITIYNDELSVELKVGSNKVLINKEEVKLPNFPILEDDATYLPLRSVSEIFGIKIDYNHHTKCITLIKINDAEDMDKAPTADFQFAEDTYTEGQAVKVIDKSYDREGNLITSRLWMVDNNHEKANSNLENIFSKPKEGKYVISLKVKNDKGIWSDWVSKQIVINPNLKPVVTSLLPGKDTYHAGEALGFTYTYDNEPWEGIKAQRWTYREINEPVSKEVAEKPRFIFHEGQYVISLRIQDDNNNWSDVERTVINIKGKPDQSELEYRFTQGEIGDLIDNFENFNYQDYKLIEPDRFAQAGGTLLMSDSPEVVKETGILYKDTINGIGRILIHHLNGYTNEMNELGRKRLVVVAENTTDSPANFSIKNKVIKGPHYDGLYVGQRLLYDFLANKGKNESYSLQPGEKAYIYDSGKSKWGKGDLISGVMDFDVNGPITVTVAAVEDNTTLDDIELLKELSKDVHPRGTFDKTDIYYEIDLKDKEPTKILLGTGAEEWINGYDAITGELVQNRGNYGVTYNIKITAKEDTGIILNPRAGFFRGAVRWDGKDVYLTPNKAYISGHNSKAIMLGVIKAGETKELEYVLPNGSASPVLLGFIPKEHWN